jgi:hypothetical protein
MTRRSVVSAIAASAGRREGEQMKSAIEEATAPQRDPRKEGVEICM